MSDEGTTSPRSLPSRMSSHDDPMMDAFELRILGVTSAREWFLIISSLVLASACGCFIFGWGPLSLIFQYDGIYSDACTEELSPCEEQARRVDSMYSSASGGYWASQVIGGFVLSKYNPVAGAALSGVAFAFGSLLLAGPEEGIHVGLALFGGGGSIIELLSADTIKLSRVHASTLLVVMMSVRLISCFMPVLMYNLYIRGFSRQTIFIAFGLLMVSSLLLFVASWYGRPYGKRKTLKAREARYAARARAKLNPDTAEQRPRLHGLTVCQQLATVDFFWIATIGTVHHFLVVWFLGTFPSLLIQMGDAQTGYAYTQVTAACGMATPLFAPFARWCISLGSSCAFAIMAVVGILVFLAAQVPSLPFQLVTLVIFVMYRACAGGISSAVLNHVFGNNSTFIQGISALLVAASSGLIPFIVRGVDTFLGGDMRLAYAAWPFMLLFVILPVNILYRFHMLQHRSSDLGSK